MVPERAPVEGRNQQGDVPMKTLIGAAAAVVLLSGAAMAQTMPSGPLVAQMAATPFHSGNGHSEAMPIFNYQGDWAVTASVPFGRSNGIAHQNGSTSLVYQTGDGS
jgi:hypothetical protein